MWLNNNFYKSVCAKTIDESEFVTTYTAYTSIYSNPLILFSEFESTPIFALELQYSDKKMYDTQVSLFTDLTGTTNNHTNHQGIVTEDDQEIEFIATNLTNHNLHFSIIQGNNMVINKINILESLETIVIKSNAINDKLLKFKTHQSGITLREKLTDSKLPETQIHLTVNPENNQEFNRLFDKTIWKSSNIFILKSTHKKNLGIDTIHPNRLGHNVSHDFRDISPIIPKYVVNPWLQSSIEPDRTMHRLVTDQDTVQPFIQDDDTTNDTDDIDTEIDDNMNQRNYDISEYLPREREEDWFTTLETVGFQNSHLNNIYRPIGANTISWSHRNATYDLGDNVTIDIPKYVTSPWLQVADNLMNSRVGSIEYSDKKHHVNTYDSMVDINYNVSAMTIFGLTLLQGNYTVTKSETDNDNEYAETTINEYVNKIYIPLIKTLYPTETCLACTENKTNILFYSCGHSCVCKVCCVNIKKCPLCRDRFVIALNI
jgi:hypothetical protein